MKPLRIFRMADAGGESGGSGGDGSAAAASAGGNGTLLASADSSSSSQQASASSAAASSGFAWAGNDGALNEKWIDQLPENLRGEDSLRVIKSIPDLAGSYVATKAMVGKRLEAPGEGATPEQIAAWRKTVGAPEKPEGYYSDDLKTYRPDNIPESLWNQETEKGFMAVAHKHHLPPGAVKEIMKFYGDTIAGDLRKSVEQQNTVLQAESDKLRKTWGGEFDTNLALAKRVAQTVGLKVDRVEDGKLIEAGDPIFTNARVVEAFAQIGRLISEDRIVKGDAASFNGSIQERIRDISDPKSQSVIAREYRGEMGTERQQQAQATYQRLLQTESAKK